MNTTGTKHDQDKPRLGLVLGGFARALQAVGEVGTYGAKKYTDDGWKVVPNGEQRYTDAMLRHLLADFKGECEDPESGLLHAAHAAWNALARLEFQLGLDVIDESEEPSEDITELPPIPEGFVLYGQGPLKHIVVKADVDICWHDPRSVDFCWYPLGYGTNSDMVYCLREGSEIAELNGLCATHKEVILELPYIPEGFVLYGKSPLKYPPWFFTKTIAFCNPELKEWSMTGSWGAEGNYCALRDGSEIAKLNGL